MTVLAEITLMCTCITPTEYDNYTNCINSTNKCKWMQIYKVMLIMSNCGIPITYTKSPTLYLFHDEH